jgi:hypothetical protein
MSSYAKRMFETTATWLAANPVPGDPFLHVPRRTPPANTPSTPEEQRAGDAMIAAAREIAESEGIPEEDMKRFILAHLVRAGVTPGKEEELEDSMPASIRALGPASSARLRGVIQHYLDEHQAKLDQLRGELDQAFTNITGAVAETGGCGSDITDHLPIWIKLPLLKKSGEITIS